MFCLRTRDEESVDLYTISTGIRHLSHVLECVKMPLPVFAVAHFPYERNFFRVVIPSTMVFGVCSYLTNMGFKLSPHILISNKKFELPFSSDLAFFPDDNNEFRHFERDFLDPVCSSLFDDPLLDLAADEEPPEGVRRPKYIFLRVQLPTAEPGDPVKGDPGERVEGTAEPPTA